MSIVQALLYGSKLPIQFITGVQGSAIANGQTSVVIPVHSTGDMLIAYGSSRAPTAPSFSSTGWTQIKSAVATGTILGITYGSGTTSAYKIGSGASETITFFGSGSNTDIYSGCLIFRNVSSIGASNTSSSISTGTSVTIPSLALTKTDGSSAVCAFTHIPYISSTTNGMTINNGMAYQLNVSSFAGGTATTSKSMRLISHSIELVN